MRAQEGQPGVDRAAAVGRAAVGQRELGRLGPALRFRRPAPAAWRAARRARRPRVALEAVAGLQPLEPALGGRDAAALVGGRTHCSTSRATRSTSPVCCAYPIAAPDPRAPRTSRLPASAGRRRDRARPAQSADRSSSWKRWWYRYHSPPGSSGTRNRLECASDSSAEADPLSSRTASHSGPDSRSSTEVRVRKRSSSAESCGEQLRLKVVRHQEIASGEAVCRGLSLRAAGPDRQRGEVQARGPALGVRGELGDLGVRQLHAGRSQQLAAPGRRPCADRPGRSPAPGPAPATRPAPARARRERTGRAASHREHVARASATASRHVAVMQQMQVIEHQHERLVRRRPALRPAAARSFPRPRRPATPAPRTRSRRAARRGRARSRHTSAGRSDRCPCRRRSPTRTAADDRAAHSASSVVFPQPGPADRNTTGTAARALDDLDQRLARHRPAATLRRQQLRLQQLERGGGPLVAAVRRVATSRTTSPRVQPTIEDELTRRPPGGVRRPNPSRRHRPMPCPPDTWATLTLPEARPRLSRLLTDRRRGVRRRIIRSAVLRRPARRASCGVAPRDLMPIGRCATDAVDANLPQECTARPSRAAACEPRSTTHGANWQ